MSGKTGCRRKQRIGWSQECVMRSEKLKMIVFLADTEMGKALRRTKAVARQITYDISKAQSV